MKFETELNLVNRFKENYILNLDIDGPSVVLEEVGLGFGIADLVIGELIYDNENLRIGREPLRPIDVGIYKIVEREQRVTVESVSYMTRCSKRQVSIALEKLVRAAFVKKEDLFYVLTKPYELVFRQSIAIEAKLKNWKRAMMQAYRYKWFADYSYVVLDANYIKPALENIGLFKEYNVGLLSLSTEGEFQNYFSPHKEKPIDSKMQILLSETLLFKDHTSCPC